MGVNPYGTEGTRPFNDGPGASFTMLFNVDKCKIVHFGFNNTLASYQLNDIIWA